MYAGSDFGKDFQQLLDEFGGIVRFKYFSTSGASTDYDDAPVFTQSGTNVWCSGIIAPVTNRWGSQEAILLEQGILTQNDKMLYVNGSIVTSGTYTAFTVGTGSPTTREFAMIDPGVTAYESANQILYKCIYMRTLPNGSLYGS